MKHFPIFMALEGRRIIVSGGGDAAIAKLRLLMKTEGRITVFAEDVSDDILNWANEGRLTIVQRALAPGDAMCAKLFYAANEDDAEDARVAALAHADGALVNIVDNLGDSEFITPAIVDRDPVTIAIGTEGAAPVLARAIKKDLEEKLPARLGTLARIGKAFRHAVEVLPMGRKRRDFWADYYFKAGPAALEDGEEAVTPALETLLGDHLNAKPRAGHIDFVGAGPGDPDLLTMKARRALDTADVVLYDRLVAPEILELARREAQMIEVGKTGFGQSMSQDAINDLIIDHGSQGHHVVRLKSGDPAVFGRLEEELDAVEAAGITYTIVPGITAASGAVAAMGRSFTRRGRNGSMRMITGHDMNGFADHDWRALAQPGEVAAIYMGKRAARFVQGRLLMFGADPATAVSIVTNVSRSDQQILPATLSDLPEQLSSAVGPAVLFYGLAPRSAALEIPRLEAQA